MPRRRITLLVGFVFVDVLGFSLFFPLLPYYAELYGAGATLVGLMIASNAAAQLIAAPVVGRLSDYYGRRPLLMLSIGGTLVSFLILALAEPIGARLAINMSALGFNSTGPSVTMTWTVAVLFFCRILDGLAGGNVSLARAYVADITDADSRAQGLGFIGAAFGLGFVIGPVIGGSLSNWDVAAELFSSLGLSRFAVPALVAAVIAALNLIGVAIWLPESLPPEKRGVTLGLGRADRNPLRLFAAFRQPRLRPLLLTRLVFSLALTLFMANFALYGRYHLSLSDQITSYVMTYAGLVLILVQAFGIGWMTKRFLEQRILVSGLYVLTGALIFLALVADLVSLLLVLLPLAVSGGILNTVINSLISKSVSDDEVGSALGLATAAESLSWVLAPSMGGFLIECLGGRSIGVAGAVLTACLAFPVSRNFNGQRIGLPQDYGER